MSILDGFVERDMIDQVSEKAQKLAEVICKLLPVDWAPGEVIWDETLPGFIIDNNWFIIPVVDDIPSIRKGQKAVFWQPQVSVYNPPINGEPGLHDEKDLGGPFRKFEDALVHIIKEIHGANLELYVEQAQYSLEENTGEKQ